MKFIVNLPNEQISTLDFAWCGDLFLKLTFTPYFNACISTFQ